jgi:single-strand DNA-binding protein
MKSLNNVQLIGHLGQTPEAIDYDGKLIVKFSVATNEQWLDKVTGEKIRTTEWHKAVCFNKLAEIVKKFVNKGAKVYLSGKLKTSKWLDKNKMDHYTTEIVVEELIMLDAKPSSCESDKHDGALA